MSAAFTSLIGHNYEDAIQNAQCAFEFAVSDNLGVNERSIAAKFIVIGLRDAGRDVEASYLQNSLKQLFEPRDATTKDCSSEAEKTLKSCIR